MGKTERLIQLCESVIENNGSVFGIPCNEIECRDCPLGFANRKDGKRCSYDDKATLEVAKNFLAEAGVSEQEEQESEKTYSFDEIVLMNLKGGIERGTKFISDYNTIGVLSNRTLKISSLKEGNDPVISPSEMFIMTNSYLTKDDFDLEEEFQILGYEGIFKKIELYGQIKVVRRLDNGRVSVYDEYYLEDEDRLIRVNN